MRLLWLSITIVFALQFFVFERSIKKLETEEPEKVMKKQSVDSK